MGDNYDKRKRTALTLLEVMLALALSGIVITLVGAAINVHLRAVDAQRM